jgi:hypothetical protein
MKASENIILAPRCRQVVQGRLELESEQSLPPLVIVEPVQIPIEGIFTALALTRVEPSARQSSPVKSQAGGKVPQRADRAYAMLANFSRETLTVPKAAVLGVAEEVSEDLVERINAEKDPDMNSLVKPPRKRKQELLHDQLLQEITRSPKARRKTPY